MKEVSKEYEKDSSESLAMIKDMNLSINKDEFIYFLGSSGCGESTLLNILAGFQPAS